MNAQKLFDDVVTRLRAQEWQQSLDEFGCAYRGGNGRRCGIGVLISDAAANQIIQGAGGVAVRDWATIPEETALARHELAEAYGVTDKDYAGDDSLLRACQRAHDGRGRTTGEEMEARFRAVAKQFGLTFPESSVSPSFASEER